MSTSSSGSSIRKNFDFDPRYIETMARLKDLCGLKTDTSVIEEALVLLGWAAAEVAKGRKIGSYDEATSTLNEITSTALEKARYWLPVAASSKAPASPPQNHSAQVEGGMPPIGLATSAKSGV